MVGGHTPFAFVTAYAYGEFEWEHTVVADVKRGFQEWFTIEIAGSIRTHPPVYRYIRDGGVCPVPNTATNRSSTTTDRMVSDPSRSRRSSFTSGWHADASPFSRQTGS